MRKTIRAKYENGVFKPLEDVSIEKGTIVEVQVPWLPDLSRKSPAITELGFFGMWKDRIDMEDSVEYINNLRRPRPGYSPKQ
jgi:predicted DNA-binding antitoxin AbrB/MazE fold protein